MPILASIGRSPMAPSQLPIRLRITPASPGDFPPDCGPKLRIEDARRADESSLGEQLAPRRADAGAEVVGLQQHGAGGAQFGVEPVVPLLLALEPLDRDVRAGRGSPGFAPAASPAFGVSSSRRFVESASRGVSLGDRPLQARGQARRSGRAEPASPCHRGSRP